jgi:hypothetical protein
MNTVVQEKEWARRENREVRDLARRRSQREARGAFRVAGRHAGKTWRNAPTAYRSA